MSSQPRVITSDGTNVWRLRGYQDALQRRASRVAQVREDYGADAAMTYAAGYRHGKKRREEISG